jgi:pimeloyl-ACP methyl ester carboxylesterase
MTTPVEPAPAAPAFPSYDDDDLGVPAGDARVVTTDDGAALAVTVAAPAAGTVPAPAVVLSHCWTGGRSVWSLVARRLVAAGHPVVLYDQRGHGVSTLGNDPYSVERLGDDLATVVEAVDVRDAVVAGHSMGGMSVMSCACRHPDLIRDRVRGLALVATACHGLGRRAIERAALSIVREDRANRLLAHPRVGRALVRPVFGKEAHRLHVEETRALFVATPWAVREAAAVAMQAMDLRAGLAAVDAPAVVVLGRRDRLIANGLTRAIVTAIPGATAVELAGAGHMLPFERPDEVAAAIAALA